MPLAITVDVFSGRPNPTVVLRGAEEREALKRLRPAGRARKEDRPAFPEGRLGYRGLLIEQIGAPAAGLPRSFRLTGGVLTGPKLSHQVADETFEEFVCGSSGPVRRLFPEADLTPQLLGELDRFRRDWEEWRPPRRPVWPAREHCRCAPLYEPAWWNDPSRQFANNCYNYSTDYRTDTFAQPGLAAGAMYTSLDCPAVRAAALAGRPDRRTEREQPVPAPGPSGRARDLARRRLPLVPERPKRLLVTQARLDARHQPRQQRPHHPRPAHGKPRRLHRLLHLHDRDARPHQNPVTWQAGVSLFSGRPDPTWPLDDEVAARLVSRWETLEPTHEPIPEPPQLGYRGAFLLAPDGRRWLAYGTIVALDDEHRHDPEAQLEHELLATAPPGTLPPHSELPQD